VAYAASKAGLVALTKHTAAFYASEAIRCNAIIPGVMYTKMLDHVDEGDFNAEGFKKAEAGHALSRMCSLDAVAELVVFLFNSKAHTINGAIIAADGGFSAG
jgi:NAD(P)-dependent dehydrogenase (short-subunit alcohol dehydrogenase family)